MGKGLDPGYTDDLQGDDCFCSGFPGHGLVCLSFPLPYREGGDGTWRSPALQCDNV